MESTNLKAIVQELYECINQREALDIRIANLAAQLGGTPPTALSQTVAQPTVSVRDVVAQIFKEKRKLSIAQTSKELKRRYTGAVTSRTAARAIRALKDKGILRRVDEGVYELIE